MEIGPDSFKRISNIATNIKLIESVQEYLEYVEYFKWDFHQDNLWFRGVSHAKYKLIPSIYRSQIWDYDDEQAEWIFEQFARKAKPYIRDHHSYTKWQWYFLMQHYGMPTRLLDWTEGSLIALYFAVRNPLNAHIPSVYVLNPFWFDEVSHQRKKSKGLIFGVDQCFITENDSKILAPYLNPRPSLPDYPLCVEPPETDYRIAAQRSVFTVHGKKLKGFEEVSKNNEDALLFQLRLTSRIAENIKNELNTMGINEVTLFPDLEGLSRFIKWDYGMS